jgi:hypothetical protein
LLALVVAVAVASAVAVALAVAVLVLVVLVQDLVSVLYKKNVPLLVLPRGIPIFSVKVNAPSSYLPLSSEH